MIKRFLSFFKRKKNIKHICIDVKCPGNISDEAFREIIAEAIVGIFSESKKK